MKAIAQVTGMTEDQLKEFYIQKVNEARLFGFSEAEAKLIVQDTFKSMLIK